MKEIIIASANKHKLDEIKSILNDYKVISMEEAGFDDDIVEDGKTFEAGMIVKVKEIRGVTLYVTESDAMPKKAEEAEAPKESEQ